MGRDNDCDDHGDRGDFKFDGRAWQQEGREIVNTHSLTVDHASGLSWERVVVGSRYGNYQLTSNLRLDLSADGRAAGKRVTAVYKFGCLHRSTAAAEGGTLREVAGPTTLEIRLYGCAWRVSWKFLPTDFTLRRRIFAARVPCHG